MKVDVENDNGTRPSGPSRLAAVISICSVVYLQAFMVLPYEVCERNQGLTIGLVREALSLGPCDSTITEVCGVFLDPVFTPIKLGSLEVAVAEQRMLV